MNSKFMKRDAGGLVLTSTPGDGFAVDPTVTNYTTDAAYTMTVADLAGGIFQRSGTNTSRTDTTPTAALLIAAYPEWNVGDAKVVLYSNAAGANPTTIGAGTNVTLVGLATVAAGSNRFLVFVKASSTTVTCYIC